MLSACPFYVLCAPFMHGRLHKMSVCLAVAGFAAYWFNKIQVDRLLLIKALAGVQLFTALVNLITRIGTLDKVPSSLSSSASTGQCLHACPVHLHAHGASSQLLGDPAQLLVFHHHRHAARTSH